MTSGGYAPPLRRSSIPNSRHHIFSGRFPTEAAARPRTNPAPARHCYRHAIFSKGGSGVPSPAGGTDRIRTDVTGAGLPATGVLSFTPHSYFRRHLPLFRSLFHIDLTENTPASSALGKSGCKSSPILCPSFRSELRPGFLPQLFPGKWPKRPIYEIAVHCFGHTLSFDLGILCPGGQNRSRTCSLPLCLRTRIPMRHLPISSLRSL